MTQVSFTLFKNLGLLTQRPNEILSCNASSFTGSFMKIDTWAQPILATHDTFFIYIGQKLRAFYIQAKGVISP